MLLVTVVEDSWVMSTALPASRLREPADTSQRYRPLHHRRSG